MHFYLRNNLHFGPFLFRILSILVLILSSNRSISQEFSGKSYTVEDGLCKNTIRDIIQDGDGFIWLATDEGIDRFDGSEFKHYDLEKGDFPLGLKNHVQKLYISTDSILWVGTRRGPMRYDKLKDEFYMPGSILNSSISEWNIYSFQSGVNNDLWIGGYHGYTILDGDSLKSKYTNADILAVWSLCMNSDGFMWMGYKDGLKRIDPQTGEQKDYFPILPRKYPDESLIIRDIVTLDHGDLLLMTVPEGVYQYSLRSDSFEKTTVFQEERERIITTSIEFDPAGTYLFGIDGIGLVLTDTNYTILQAYGSPEKDPAIVDRIYVDTDGAYWIASRGNGIQYHNPNRISFQSLNVQSGELSVQRGNDVFSIVQDREGSLWAGTNMGINIWDENFLHYNTLLITDISPDINNDRVRVLCEDNRGSFWIGTYSEGLIHYNPASGKSTLYQENRRKSLGSNFIATIYQDSEGAIWVGSIRSHLSRLNPETGAIQSYPVNNIRCLTESKNKEILAGSFDGLFILNPETGSFKHYHSNVDSEYRLSNSRISCISVDSVGIIYLGTHGGGVNIIDRKQHTIAYLTSEDGLPSNHISGIVIDQHSDLWISTSNGLTSWNKKEGTLKIYNASDGLFTSEFNTGAYWKSKDGTLFFGGRGGISIIEPDVIYEKEVTHTVYFDEFFVNNKKMVPATADSPLTEHINATEIIRLRHDENSFGFKFTALDFDTQGKNRYKWILEGFDQAWSRPVDIREAGYANIPPGKYTFKVGFSENGLTWDKVRTIEVIILPPWWATQLAKITYLILGLAFFMFIAYFLYLRIKKKNAEEKIRFFANIAHEIASPLSLISGPLNDLEVQAASHAENREENLRAIQKNLRRIHNLVKQLLEFQKLDLKTNSVIGSTLKFPDSIEEVLFEFQPRCKKKNLKLSLESHPADFAFRTDKDMLAKILGNLISNAIKYTGDGGEIKITCACQKELLRIEVRDNGIGIPKDQQRNLFRRYFRADNAVLSREAGTGIGMMLVYSLTKMLGAKIRFSSKENIGTTFRIEIPQLKHKNQLKSREVQVESDRGEDPGSYLKGKGGPDKHGESKLFIIEDNHDLRKYLENYFKHKYQVRAFNNGEQVLDCLKNEHPDLIITDVMMEGISGLELCQKIKGNIALCHIPIVLITALVSDDSEIDGMQFGADAYVKKPFDMKVLEARVENLLHGRKVLRDKFIGADVDINKIEFQAELDKAFMEKVAAIVAEHLEESDFSVIRLSRELGMSRPALYVKIKELTGKSPQEFIKLIKLQKAKKLLLLGQMTVMEVAYETGFNDAKYFSTTFKKHFGMSPSEVRSK